MFKSSIAVIGSLLLISPSVLAVNLLTKTELTSQKLVNTGEIAQLDDPEIRNNLIAYIKDITVEITTNNNRGSGTLIGKQGNTYLVLTNNHVIDYAKAITINTHDGKKYQGKLINNILPQGYDLALIQFTSPQAYTVANDDITTPAKDNPVIAAGYLAETGEFITSEGKITHTLTPAFKEGYSIGYTSNIKQGMSGGPIINSQGSLIGINGRSSFPILNTGYIYPDESVPNDAEIKQYRQVSWGIPLNTFLTYVKPEILATYSLPFPQGVAQVTTPTHTGYLGQLEAKTKEFTVRIDSSSGSNGSGVIIAKEGQTYTVLTADHVLCEKTFNSNAQGACIEEFNYTLTTHDGKTQKLNESSIIRQEGVDLAVFKFESNDNYSVAELADYNPKRRDYVFAAGFPKIRQNTSQWLFSGGFVYGKELGLIQARQSDYIEQASSNLPQISSLTGGYELVYTSITYGGMSGGAVIDAQGRVIGIHGRSEGAGGGSIQLGYSLGIPIRTFITLKERFKINANALLLSTQQPQINQPQIQEIANAINKITVPDTNATADIWIERGGQLWRLGKNEEAVKAYDQAIQQNDPDNVYLAYYGTGLALGNLGKYQESVQALNRAVTTLPSSDSPDYSAEFHSDILLRQSVTYRYLKNRESALTAINQAIKLSPNNPNLYNEKVIVLMLLKRTDEALTAINQGIKRMNRSLLYNNRGKIYYEQQKWDLALADFNKSIELNPDFPLVYSNRGDIYRTQKKCDLALADYNKVIASNINSDYKKYVQKMGIQCYKDRAIDHVKQQKWDLALTDFSKVIELNPSGALDYMNRGNVYKELQQYNLALEDFSTAIQLEPKQTLLYSKRGNLYVTLQKWNLAIADFSKMIELDPNDAKAYYSRGEIHKNFRKWDLALTDFDKAIQLNPNYPPFYTNRGAIYAQQQKWELALKDFNKAIKLAPNYDYAYLNRGQVFLELQQTDKAIKDLKKAAELFRQQGNQQAYQYIMQMLQQLE
ncbi:MAG: tetratricopeptide repeat protein [Microcystaceae cyanobacterium]